MIEFLILHAVPSSPSLAPNRLLKLPYRLCRAFYNVGQSIAEHKPIAMCFQICLLSALGSVGVWIGMIHLY